MSGGGVDAELLFPLQIFKTPKNVLPSYLGLLFYLRFLSVMIDEG